MDYKLSAKSTIFCLIAMTAFGCQNQTNSNSADQRNFNVAANNSNTVNHSNPGAQVAPPQTVKFESAEKVEIVGTFYQSPKANSPAVLLMHQWQSSRKSFDEFAKRLQMQGFSVLAIDGRGFGDSIKTTDGKEVKQNPEVEKLDSISVKNMTADVGNAFQFLAKQKNVDASRIGIVGASYGSSLAIIYAAENKQIKAVALLSPGINYFENMPTEPAVKGFGDRPLLMIAADDDKDSADAVKKLKEIGAGEKYEIKIYEKGGHGTNLFESKVGLEDLLEKFLTKNL